MSLGPQCLWSMKGLRCLLESFGQWFLLRGTKANQETHSGLAFFQAIKYEISILKNHFSLQFRDWNLLLVFLPGFLKLSHAARHSTGH